MNWSRGLLRAWVAVTVLWLAGCALYVWAEWPQPDTPAVAASDGYIRDKDGDIDWAETLLKGHKPREATAAKYDPEDVRNHLFYASLGAFIPPPLLFVFGWGLLWIARGFRS